MRSLVLALAAAALFSACASSALDKDFRRKVQAIDVNEQAGFDPVSKAVTGQVSAHFVLRDPDAKVVKPPTQK